MAAFLEPIAQDHKKALEIKNRVPVLVCLGNPPYDRTKAGDKTLKGNPDQKLRAITGGWVRYGQEGEKEPPLMESFIKPAIRAGYGGDLKNLYNLYIYFWRWGLWKVFEHETAAGPGIVSFITASSYLEGRAFVGMREQMRRLCDEIWILDLGGEGRGTRRDENVFAIQTPVAIAIAVRYKKPHPDNPAKVHYFSIEGSRKEKCDQLDNIDDFSKIQWQNCGDDWQDTFKPKGVGKFFSWPKIDDLFPWQISGVQVKRTWPIDPHKNILERLWKALLSSSDRAKALKETRDRKISNKYNQIFPFDQCDIPIVKLPETAALPVIQRYGYRSFDRQWLLADNRICDYMRPELWEAYSEKQVYLTTLINHPLGNGPALTVSAYVPDLHHFRGSYGAKEVLPLFYDKDSTKANINTELFELLNQTYHRKVTPEDFLSYIYGILAQPSYTEKFHKELDSKEVRVPLTRDRNLFFNLSKIGRRLIWLHTYGERFIPKGKQSGEIPQGKARCLKSPKDYPQAFSFNSDKKSIIIGNGEFGPVEQDIWGFEVSGLKVVQSWLGYRKNPSAGKKSSPLDDIYPEQWPPEFTTELLQLLWVLEATLKEYPRQESLLKEVLKKKLFLESDLPNVMEESRKPSEDNPFFGRNDI
jgi:predicted helicase